MRAKVWIQSNQHIVVLGPPSIIRNVPTYTYPMECWHYSGLDAFTRKPIKVKISLDLNRPNPTYALRNPPEKSIFPSLFNSRWYLFAVFGQGHKAQLRQKAEAAQWHFIDRFFGEGIKLHYLDAEYFSRQPVMDHRLPPLPAHKQRLNPPPTRALERRRQSPNRPSQHRLQRRPP